MWAAAYGASFAAAIARYQRDGHSLVTLDMEVIGEDARTVADWAVEGLGLLGDERARCLAWVAYGDRAAEACLASVGAAVYPSGIVREGIESGEWPPETT